MSIAQNFKENKITTLERNKQCQREKEFEGCDWVKFDGGRVVWENRIQSRWREYFDQLLNGDAMSEQGNINRREGVKNDNERVVRRWMKRMEVVGELSKRKNGKATALYGIIMEMLKNGVNNIVDWLLRIFNRYMEPEVMKVACIAPYIQYTCEDIWEGSYY